MADSKEPVSKKTRGFSAPIESQIDGLQIVGQSKTQPGDATGSPTGGQVEIPPPPPALVSKLINFIKKI